MIALGELGLDYYYDHSPRDVQQQVFRRQLEQAAAAKLPVVIHCRDAWDDCLAILDQDWRPAGLGGIFHCFTGTLDEARRGMDMGFMISFAGNVTYPKMQHLATFPAKSRWKSCSRKRIRPFCLRKENAESATSPPLWFM